MAPPLRPLRQLAHDLMYTPVTLRARAITDAQTRLPIIMEECGAFVYASQDCAQLLETLFEIALFDNIDATRAAILRLLASLFDDAMTHSVLCFDGLKLVEQRLHTVRRQTAPAAGYNNMTTTSSYAGHSGAAEGINFPDGSRPAIPPTSMTTPSHDASGHHESSYRSAASPSTPPPYQHHNDVSSIGGHDYHQDIMSLQQTAASQLTFADVFLETPCWRPAIVRLLRHWDTAAIDVGVFTQRPETLHVYLPNRTGRGGSATTATSYDSSTAAPRVFRDFVTCTQRPKLSRTWGDAVCAVHIKTNIVAKSDIMYRILVEGYNYGVNAPICSDVCGCTHRNWDTIGNMEKYGWPAGWDQHAANNYSPGCTISQYYSSDRYLVVRLRASSMFCVGFTASAWLVTYGYGPGYPVSATIHHQDEDL